MSNWSSCSDGKYTEGNSGISEDRGYSQRGKQGLGIHLQLSVSQELSLRQRLVTNAGALHEPTAASKPKSL